MTMNSKEKAQLAWKTHLICFLGGLLLALLMVGCFMPARVIEVEISPKGPDNALQFYVAYLKAHNYTVIEMDLKTNTYETVENINEFLWLLEYCNFTTCYVDYGKATGFLEFPRQEKLWIQMDGIYWEFRFGD